VRIGFVVEGSNEDAGDVHAIRALCLRIAEEQGISREPVVVAGGSKPDVLREANNHVAALRASGCQRVVIVWDNCPPWSGDLDADQASCEAIAWNGINDAGHPPANIFTVCSRRELEAWLLTDASVVSSMLRNIGRGSMPSISGSNQPDTIDRPKHRLHKWFYLRCNRPPTGPEYAAMFSQAKLTKLRRSASFKAFEATIAGT